MRRLLTALLVLGAGCGSGPIAPTVVPGSQDAGELTADAGDDSATLLITSRGSYAVASGCGSYIRDWIQFETGTAILPPGESAVLDMVADTMTMNPQVILVEVQGHADERDTDEDNIVLSRERAAVVAQHIIDRGVASGRLLVVGYGDHCPPDECQRGADPSPANRSVTFAVLQTAAGPTAVGRVCPAGADLAPPLPAP
jgi:outer membrane protein OmpA-like peptidoglycan-associated protein